MRISCKSLRDKERKIETTTGEKPCHCRYVTYFSNRICLFFIPTRDASFLIENKEKWTINK